MQPVINININTKVTMFHPIESGLQKNDIPIVLIDVSGSTYCDFTNKITVKDYEFSLAKEICHNLKYDRIHLITWSTNAKLYENIPITVLKTINSSTKSAGGTELVCGLDKIKPEFFNDNKSTEIFVFTDGEITDNKKKIREALQNIALNNVQLNIIAVETNNKNYFNSNVSIGNALYKVINDSNLSRLLNKFSVYNTLEIEFINMYNPIVKEGFIPFGNQMFHMSDLDKFIEFINTQISEIQSKNPDNEQLDGEMLQMVQKLSITIHHLIKNTSYQYQMQMTELFCNIFSNAKYYAQVRNILHNEINNQASGKISTFSELRKAKYLDIENININLMENVHKAITVNYPVPVPYHCSFMLTDNGNNRYIIKTYDRPLSNIKLGLITYNNSSIEIGTCKFPVAFDFSNLNGANASALQWLKFVYSYRLNISMTNEYLYYYVLCDAFVANIEIYNKYADLILNDLKYNSQLTILRDIVMNNKISIPYYVIKDATERSKLNIKPLTLHYLVVNKFIIPKMSPLASDKLRNDKFKESLREYCLKDIEIDLCGECNDIDNALHSKYNNLVKIIDLNDNDIIIAKQHKYKNLTINCSLDKVVDYNINNTNNENMQYVCELCKSCVECIKIERNTVFNELCNLVNHCFFDDNNHIHLGELTGKIDDYDLIVPDTFKSAYESFTVDNIIIIDPISNARLKINSQTEFKEYVKSKYPFLTDINMDNVALCGGFVRSILLKQQMKDFDFFFHGLNSDQEYVNRVETLTSDIINSLKKVDDKLKFAMFYKPMFNVLEIICYEDPTDHIKDDFTLDFFDKYKFRSMKDFNGKKYDDVTRYLPPEYEHGHETKSVATEDKYDGGVIDRKTKIDKKYYFEDGDRHGIKMRYRFQLIMCKYNTISDIFKSFDMFPSMLAYDNNKVYFTKKSLQAMQFMINEINVNGGNDLIKHRISKYFKYGFAIVFPPTNRNWFNSDYDNNYKQDKLNYKGTNENVGPLTFKVRTVLNNCIYINHNSHLENQLERNEQLEREANLNGTSLYTSNLFCSFVSVLRYAKINDINYAFPVGDQVYNIFEGNNIKLKNGSTELKFIECQTSIYKTTEWYPIFANSIIFNNYH